MDNNSLAGKVVYRNLPIAVNVARDKRDLTEECKI
jgi:hypothetical protein